MHAGEIKLVDGDTGQLFDREDYMTDGKSIELSKTSVRRHKQTYQPQRGWQDAPFCFAVQQQAPPTPAPLRCHIYTIEDHYGRHFIAVQNESDWFCVWAYEIWGHHQRRFIIGKPLAAVTTKAVVRIATCLCRLHDMFRNIVNNTGGIPNARGCGSRASVPPFRRPVERGFHFPLVHSQRRKPAGKKSRALQHQLQKYWLQKKRLGF